MTVTCREPDPFELADAQARLDAVLGIHRPRRALPVDGRPADILCDSCGEDYPCETAKAAGVNR